MTWRDRPPASLMIAGSGDRGGVVGLVEDEGHVRAAELEPSRLDGVAGVDGQRISLSSTASSGAYSP